MAVGESGTVGEDCRGRGSSGWLELMGNLYVFACSTLVAGEKGELVIEI